MDLQIPFIGRWLSCSNVLQSVPLQAQSCSQLSVQHAVRLVVPPEKLASFCLPTVFGLCPLQYLAGPLREAFQHTNASHQADGSCRRPHTQAQIAEHAQGAAWHWLCMSWHDQHTLRGTCWPTAIGMELCDKTDISQDKPSPCTGRRLMK